MVGAHDFGDDGEPCFLFGFQQQGDPVGLESLEIIGGSSGLEGTAPEQGSTGCLDRPGHLQNLFFAFHGAGAGNGSKVPAADFYDRAVGSWDFDDGIVGMELAVGALEGFGDPLDGFHHIQPGQQLFVHPACVSHQAHDGLELSLADMHAQSLGLEPFGKMFDLCLGGSGFQYCDHDIYSLCFVFDENEKPHTEEAF